MLFLTLWTSSGEKMQSGIDSPTKTKKIKKDIGGKLFSVWL